MTSRKLIYTLLVTLLLCFLQAAGIDVYGQNRPRAELKRAQMLNDSTRYQTADAPQLQAVSMDSLVVSMDSLVVADSIAAENKRKMMEMTAAPAMPEEPVVVQDSLPQRRKVWTPNPTKATWLALIIPGAGQIYNRKYWKLPIIYGGFAGCAYALTWNGKMYRDYTNAYRDAVNGNWDSNNILDLLPPGYMDRVSASQLTETLRRRKDTYRRYRDLSIFAFIGVYLLSVVDAYVDAELSNFDISPDLSMRVEPAMFDNQGCTTSGKSVGAAVSLRF